jgi:hypothetical protein
MPQADGPERRTAHAPAAARKPKPGQRPPAPKGGHIWPFPASSQASAACVWRVFRSGRRPFHAYPVPGPAFSVRAKA